MGVLLNTKKFIVILVVIFVTSFSVFSDIYEGFVIPFDPTSKDETSTIVSGELRITIIPVYFPDCPPTLPIDNITSTILENISDYFFWESYGAAWFTGSVAKWIGLDSNRSFYDRGSLNSPDPTIKSNASLGCQLFREEVASKFTMTESNYTEHILMLYAGGSTIHPHHDYLTIEVENVLRRCELSVAPELYSLGTIAHEIAHGLGLHDLYNKDKLNCWGEFVGNFDLMDNSGHYGINGMCAYSKMCLGWITPDEVIDIQDNATVRLLRIEEWGEGTRVVRIPIDSWRYYLVEAQYYWPNSGILVSRVDKSRKTGGYGRVEVVRTASGVTDTERSLFTEHQQFIDSNLGLMIEVVQNNDPWHEIKISFGLYNNPRTITIPSEIGEVNNVTSAVDLNGTSFFAVCAINGTTSIRTIHLYKLTDTLEYVLHTPFTNDSFNPVLVSGYNGILLVFETINSNKHSVIAQFGDNITVVSDDDDARNPTAAFSGNGLYAAYENHTGEHHSIIVRKASSYGWNYGISFQAESTSSVYPNEDEILYNPQLIPANNYAVLSYLWSNGSQNEMRLKGNINSQNITLAFNEVESFVLAPLSEYRVFLCLTQYSGLTTIYFWKSLDNELELISSHYGISIALAPILGVWEGYESSERFVFNHVWDRWYRSGDSLVLRLGISRILAGGLCSLYGSTALYMASIKDGFASITIWSILSLSIGAERPIGELLIAIGGKCLVASMLCLMLYYSGWKDLIHRLRKYTSKNTLGKS